MTNRQWLLNQNPTGRITPATWRMVDGSMPQPGPGQIRVQTEWLSLDPYMRGRIAPSGSWRAGRVMGGGGVGRVVASNHPDWAPGARVESSEIGWQEFAVLSPDAPGSARANRVPDDIPPQAALGWHGMPGLTAWVGLTRIGRPVPGDTVVISAAAGAVGQVAVQLAVRMGARVVAIAGSDDKLAQARAQGAEVGVNHRDPDLGAALRAACPDGVDVFFDNTGGPIHDAVLMRLADFARVIICGRIAVSDHADEDDRGLRASTQVLYARARLQGLIVDDWWHLRDFGLARLAALHRAGALTYAEDVLDGFDRVPEAFCRMMDGQNRGKQLVRL